MKRDNTKKERPLFPHQILGQKVSNMDNASLIQGYLDVFAHYSEQELVDEFNGLVGQAYSNIWLQALRAALIREIENRKIDTSAIVKMIDGEFYSVSYARAMKLKTTEKGKKLVGVGRSHKRILDKDED
jgi:hypothetical protein